MKVYAKFVVALAAAVAVGVSVTADGHVSLNDWFAMASALLGSLAVGAVPNQTPDDGNDDGTVDVTAVLVMVVLVLLIVFLVKRI